MRITRTLALRATLAITMMGACADDGAHESVVRDVTASLDTTLDVADVFSEPDASVDGEALEDVEPLPALPSVPDSCPRGQFPRPDLEVIGGICAASGIDPCPPEFVDEGTGYCLPRSTICAPGELAIPSKGCIPEGALPSDWPSAELGFVEVAAGDDLQAAIDAAPDGAVLRLAAGTFQGPVMITKSLWLVGGGPSSTTITSNADYTVFLRAAEGGPPPTLNVRDLAVEAPQGSAIGVAASKRIDLRGVTLRAAVSGVVTDHVQSTYRRLRVEGTSDTAIRQSDGELDLQVAEITDCSAAVAIDETETPVTVQNVLFEGRSPGGLIAFSAAGPLKATNVSVRGPVRAGLRSRTVTAEHSVIVGGDFGVVAWERATITGSLFVDQVEAAIHVVQGSTLESKGSAYVDTVDRPDAPGLLRFVRSTGLISGDVLVSRRPIALLALGRAPELTISPFVSLASVMVDAPTEGSSPGDSLVATAGAQLKVVSSVLRGPTRAAIAVVDPTTVATVSVSRVGSDGADGMAILAMDGASASASASEVLGQAITSRGRITVERDQGTAGSPVVSEATDAPIPRPGGTLDLSPAGVRGCAESFVRPEGCRPREGDCTSGQLMVPTLGCVPIAPVGQYDLAYAVRVPEDAPDLAAAFLALPAGGTIAVGPGTWTIRQALTSPYIVVGAGAGITRLVTSGAGPVFDLTRAALTLANLTIDAGELGLAITGWWSHVHLDGVDLVGRFELWGTPLDVMRSRLTHGGSGDYADASALTIRESELRTGGPIGVKFGAARLSDVAVSGSGLGLVSMIADPPHTADPIVHSLAEVRAVDCTFEGLRPAFGVSLSVELVHVDVHGVGPLAEGKNLTVFGCRVTGAGDPSGVVATDGFARLQGNHWTGASPTAGPALRVSEAGWIVSAGDTLDGVGVLGARLAEGAILGTDLALTVGKGVSPIRPAFLVERRARLALVGGMLSGAAGVALAVRDPLAVVSLEGVTFDTLTPDPEGLPGVAISGESGATLDLRQVVVRGAHGAGLWLQGCVARLERLDIEVVGAAPLLPGLTSVAVGLAAWLSDLASDDTLNVTGGGASRAALESCTVLPLAEGESALSEPQTGDVPRGVIPWPEEVTP